MQELPWVGSILIPLLVAVISKVSTLYLLFKTEAFRKLSGVEPYGHELWQKRFELWLDVFKVSVKAIHLLVTLIEEEEAEHDSQDSIDEVRKELSEILEEWFGPQMVRMLLIFDDDTMTICIKFGEWLYQFSQGKSVEADQVMNYLYKLSGVARSDLNISPLHQFSDDLLNSSF